MLIFKLQKSVKLALFLPLSTRQPFVPADPPCLKGGIKGGIFFEVKGKKEEVKSDNLLKGKRNSFEGKALVCANRYTLQPKRFRT